MTLGLGWGGGGKAVQYITVQCRAELEYATILTFQDCEEKLGHVKKTNWGDNVIVFLGHRCQGQKLQIGKDVLISKEGPLMCN